MESCSRFLLFGSSVLSCRDVRLGLSSASISRHLRVCPCSCSCAQGSEEVVFPRAATTKTRCDGLAGVLGAIGLPRSLFGRVAKKEVAMFVVLAQFCMGSSFGCVYCCRSQQLDFLLFLSMLRCNSSVLTFTSFRLSSAGARVA
jgi:hypothetical protein